jgi:hypothetical protein
MSFNTLPIKVHCGFCRAMKKLDDGRWVPKTPEEMSVAGAMISGGTCPTCEARWRGEEKRINDEIKENERRLKASLPKVHKK